jgi:exopolysaccharide biosynthesis polyprenyl glycosylphosphotransferase
MSDLFPEKKPSREEAAASHWAKAQDPLMLAAWKRKMEFKAFWWRFTFGLADGLKRVLDIVGSVVGLILFAPLMAIVALCIFMEDRGPVFFRQVRIGKGGKIFHIWKFRSMRMDAEALKTQLLSQNQHGSGVTFKMAQDPRITKVGRFLRKTSLDEVPQFINVFKGEMALVGPRPPVPKEVAQYTAVQLRRLKVKPGITCLWQVGGRANIDFQGQVRLDLQYIRSESLWNDIKILLLTIPAVILGKGAY